MALPLISFVRDGSPADNPNPDYSVQLIEATAQALSASFSSVRVCHPIFVYGFLGKNSVLAALLGQARPVLEEPERCFECGDYALDGVYVWPEPVHVGEVTYLLIKMRRPVDDSQENYMELRRKVRMVLALLSSVCCLCEENSKLLAGIDSFFQDYHPISQQLHLEICRLQVFMEKSWFKRPKEKSELDLRLTANKPLLDCVFRERNTIENSWIPSLAALLTDQMNPFNASHSHFWGETPYLPSFLKWTAAFVALVNLNLTFPAFVSKLPNTTDPEAEQSLVSTLETAARVEAIGKNGAALQFVIRSETAEGVALNLDPGVYERIQQTYKLAEPTVVLMLMGLQGIGKSTQLNHIVQYITEMPKLPSIFKTGNTTTHTTKGSQVLSHPLFYKNHQIMLMDLEGLEGTETQDPKEAILQANLVSALLTVASVPCLLINNSTQSLRFVDKYVTQIIKLQVDFGFCTERIFLLFHDRNPEAEAASNKEFEELVHQLNCRHFKKRQVIKVLNKPNFVNPDADSQRQFFLRTLLDDSLYIKKSVSQVHVNIQEMLTQISVIATHETIDLSELKAMPLDPEIKAAYTGWKKVEIKSFQQSTKSSDDQHLLIYFNEVIRAHYANHTDEELNRLHKGLREQCRQLVELELNRVKAEMIEIEACYNFIRVVPKQQMVDNVVSLVKYFHKVALCLVDFIPKVKALKTKLKLVRSYFPESNDRVDPLLKALKATRKNRILWSSAIYAGQIILTVGTAGAGAAIGAGVTAARTGVATAQGVAQGAALLTGRVVGAAVGLGLGVGGNLSGGICSAMVLTQKAVELVWVNSAYGNGKVNKEMLEAKDGRENPSFDPNNKVLVLLFIGSKRTLVSEFANAFVRHIAPFTPAEFQAFNINKYTQILAFDYIHPDQSESITRSYLICLRMKKPQAKYYHAMLKIAELLVPVASVAYLLVNSESQYAEPLLDAVCPPPTPDQIISEATQMKTRVLVLQTRAVDTGRLRRALHRCDVNYGTDQIEEFRQEHIQVKIAEIKREVDHSKIQPFQEFKDKVDSLPKALKPYRL